MPYNWKIKEVKIKELLFFFLLLWSHVGLKGGGVRGTTKLEIIYLSLRLTSQLKVDENVSASSPYTWKHYTVCNSYIKTSLGSAHSGWRSGEWLKTAYSHPGANHRGLHLSGCHYHGQTGFSFLNVLSGPHELHFLHLLIYFESENINLCIFFKINLNIFTLQLCLLIHFKLDAKGF